MNINLPSVVLLVESFRDQLLYLCRDAEHRQHFAGKLFLVDCSMALLVGLGPNLGGD